MPDQNPHTDLDQLRRDLKSRGGFLAAFVFDELAPKLIPPGSIGRPAKPKRVNDPIWKLVALSREEVAILDLPLMQRLRRVRQLGLANFVYPSAQHSRLEHSIGALHAASRLFDQIAADITSTGGTDPNLRRNIRLAALTHDCGHAAFSHASESAINGIDSIATAVADINRVLDRYFHDPVRTSIAQITQADAVQGTPRAAHGAPPADLGSVESLGKKRQAVAEVVSALLILSKEFSDFLISLRLDASDILQMASFVLGRPYGLKSSDGRRYFDFAKLLVAGDLDADKIDYVARDAYFAGIPIAADVERLISQITGIEYDLRQPGIDLPEKCFLLGVHPPGVAAVEMFIITRAYLFDRIYQHPKVRAAERLLEKALRNGFKTRAETAGEEAATSWLLGILYDMSGDDGALYALTHTDLAGNATASIDAILRRRLPERVLAVSQRYSFGYEPTRGLVTGPLKQTWVIAGTEMSQAPEQVADIIAQYASLSPGELMIVDWPKKAPIKENPEVYVRQTHGRGRLVTVSRYFDAAQLSKAYEEVKSVLWLFSDASDNRRVAAAAATVLNALYGIVPSDEALDTAKIPPDQFDSHVARLARALRESGDEIGAAKAEEVLKVRGDNLRFPSTMIAPYIPFDDINDQKAVAELLAEGIARAGLLRSHMQDTAQVLPVVQLLLEHEKASVAATTRHALPLDEAEFQKSVLEFMEKERRSFQVQREHENTVGRVDLVFNASQQLGSRIAVELKAEDAEFDTIVRNRLSQPFHYAAEGRYGRIALLYCRFRSDRADRPASFIQVHGGGTAVSPLAVICIGQRATTVSASRQRQAGRGARKGRPS